MHMWLLHTYLPVYDPAKSIRMHVGMYARSLRCAFHGPTTV